MIEAMGSGVACPEHQSSAVAAGRRADLSKLLLERFWWLSNGCQMNT